MSRRSSLRPARPVLVVLALLVTLLVTLLAPVLAAGAPAHDTVATARQERAARAPFVVVAAGDIACPPGVERTPVRCQQRATARLAASLRPDAVMALGDLQYEDGLLREFRLMYDPSWGRLLSRTWPVPGNHEYLGDDRATGYFTYFASRLPGRPGNYVRRAAGWRVYAVNSNCAFVSCDRQARWLRSRLARDTGRCQLVMWHHARYSSGLERGDDPRMTRLFSIAHRFRVEMVLSGHDHHYERFRPLDAHQRARRDGVVQVVSGAGGRNLYEVRDGLSTGSRARVTDRFGVVRLALRPGSVRSDFRGVDGTVRDRYERSCR